MSLQSERLLAHMLRAAPVASAQRKLRPKTCRLCDFLEQALKAESQAKHPRNVRLKTQWAHFPYNKGTGPVRFRFPAFG